MGIGVMIILFEYYVISYVKRLKAKYFLYKSVGCVVLGIAPCFSMLTRFGVPFYGINAVVAFVAYRNGESYENVKRKRKRYVFEVK